MRLLTTVFFLGLLASASVSPWSRTSVHAQQTPLPIAASTFDTGAS